MSTRGVAPAHDAIVLAGGAGRRLGGVDKSALVVAGRSLLEHVLAATTRARAVVVVGDVAVPEGVRRTVEDPPGSGPVAGIGAGLRALAGAGDGARSDTPAAWTLVLAVDQPGAVRAVRELLEAAAGEADDVDGVCHLDGRGKAQWLLATYRTPALVAALDHLGDPRGRSVRDLLAPLRLWHLPEGGHGGDVDTWEDLRDWETRLRGR